MNDNHIIHTSDLLPSALGIGWGLDQTDCLRLLYATPTRSSSRFLVAKVLVKGSPHEFVLEFDSAGKLERIEVILSMSRSFWEDSAYEAETISTQFEAQYAELVSVHQRKLGQPNFSGSWGSAGYPPDQSAGHITYWNCAEGRMQIEFDHPDKELPIFLRLACYQEQ